jgi:predicted nucleotidyltransferase component of viral defense system
MNNTIFDRMMSRYTLQTDADYHNAMHEVMQQIALAGLYRAGFFSHAAFYGGTCLRIFHGLQRFSEDLDFSLLKPDKHFNLENYFESITNEFKALGRNIVISKKVKRLHSQVESAFLKENTHIYNLQFQTERSIKIKIEVDVMTPSGFSTEPKLLLLPFSFMVKCYALSDLYAGKMHALLYRKWKKRVKGRDWYDFEWFVRNEISLNLNHFHNCAVQSHSYTGEIPNPDVLKQLLKEKILNTDINAVINDVRPFIKNPNELDIWSKEYFSQLIEMIKVLDS